MFNEPHLKYIVSYSHGLLDGADDSSLILLQQEVLNNTLHIIYYLLFKGYPIEENLSIHQKILSRILTIVL